MSHHLDYTPPVDDVSDVYIFPGPSDDDGPRTVIAMNASPQFFTADADPWNPPTGPHATMYELKLDLNDDFVEDITWRFTFPIDPPTGTQYVQIAQLTGADATSRTAPGTIITPPKAPVGQVINVPGGIKIFAGKRLDSFFTDINIPKRMRDVLPPDAEVKFNPNPDLDSLATTIR